jgi:glycerophosphoryl diester phosphodiesterase
MSLLTRPDPRPIVIAHRGASGYAPEHTIAAYDLAFHMGADYLEQDLQMTRDGVLVVMHDDTLDRTARGPATTCRGPVIAHTLEEIRTCNAGEWFNESRPDLSRPAFAHERIPTLDYVLSRFAGRARFYIETKNPEDAPGMEETLVALLEQLALLDRALGDLPAVIVQSFSAASLRKVRQLAPGLPLVLLFGRMSPARLRARIAAVAGEVDGIGPSRMSVDAAVMSAAHDNGLVVHPYTVNDEAGMRRLLQLGVDGMFSDYPDRLRSIAHPNARTD